MLPPKMKKKRFTRSRVGKNPPGWNDGVQSGIPEYKAYNDEHAQGYILQLKKRHMYNKYMREVALAPGGIRPVKNKK